jgi:hypothetical protein
MKGDRVEVVVDAGDSIRVYDIIATRAGRRVEITTGRGIVEVTEVTRGGTPVRSARFMTGRVIAMVEHPAAPTLKLATDGVDDDAPDGRGPRLPGL